ncbi:MAG: hypothetical protein ABFS18_10895 [Thermodesulfobacteriota bacterium]
MGEGITLSPFARKQKLLYGRNMCAHREFQYGGYCQECGSLHALPVQPAMTAATSLMAELEDNSLPAPFATETLFGKARGKMFGVMLTQNISGEQQIIKAFSGQLNGEWLIPGWVPPLFDVNHFNGINTPEEKRVKALSKQINNTDCKDEQLALKIARRARCRILMKNLHRLYILHNFRGEQRPMASFFHAKKGMPTGAGDCCAPKLIQHALQHELLPIGMAEFYFGRENRSKTKQHGHFYSSCASGCAPILGFMLCGLEELRADSSRQAWAGPSQLLDKPIN